VIGIVHNWPTVEFASRSGLDTATIARRPLGCNVGLETAIIWDKLDAFTAFLSKFLLTTLHLATGAPTGFSSRRAAARAATTLR
jgi:hypothetical protein